MVAIGHKELALPVLQGGMGVGISLGGLAGAVASCGAMGCISAAHPGYREESFRRNPLEANIRALKEEIAKAKLCRVAGEWWRLISWWHPGSMGSWFRRR